MPRVVDHRVYLRSGLQLRLVIQLLFQLNPRRFHQVREFVVEIGHTAEVVLLDLLQTFDFVEPDHGPSHSIKCDKKFSLGPRLRQLDRLKPCVLELDEFPGAHRVVRYRFVSCLRLLLCAQVNLNCALAPLYNLDLGLGGVVYLHLDVVVLEHFSTLILLNDWLILQVVPQIANNRFFSLIFHHTVSLFDDELVGCVVRNI